MNDQDVLAKSESNEDARNGTASDVEVQTSNNLNKSIAQNEAEASPLVFKRTRDMIVQQGTTRQPSGVTSTASTGELPLLGSFFLPEGMQRQMSNKFSEQNRDVSTSNQSTQMPIRASRVCKPPRQSRQQSKSSALSEYTNQLMFMEALNQKHLRDDSKGKN